MLGREARGRTGLGSFKDVKGPGCGSLQEHVSWAPIKEGCGCPCQGARRYSGVRPGPSGVFDGRPACDSGAVRLLVCVRDPQTRGDKG